jgi:photosystem II stability/assembly factor-like uncharacterized protein
MKKRVVVLGFVFLCLAVNGLANEPVWDDMGRGNSNLSTCFIDPQDTDIIYIGTNNAILKTEDGGAVWENLLVLSGANTAVNFLTDREGSIYAATGNGLYLSGNKGKSWKKIFQGKNASERECISAAVLPYGIFAGTGSGLFFSQDKGRSWNRQAIGVADSHILAIACDIKEPDYVYVACAQGLYRSSDKGQSWEKVFTAIVFEDNADLSDDFDDGDENTEHTVSNIRYVSIDPNNLNRLYLATSGGVYKSADRGKSWEPMTSFGLLNKEIKFLLISKDSAVYAVTKSGIFGYKNERWYELSLRLVTGEIRFLSADNKGNLYAACDNGLFKAKMGSQGVAQTEDIAQTYDKYEPSIAQVQEAAIRYAEVEPEKILEWRKAAAKKALLPQLSVSLDRNATDLWHWEGGSTTKGEDDILRRGKDAVEWDLTLSWDLSELIWNQNQNIPYWNGINSTIKQANY